MCDHQFRDMNDDKEHVFKLVPRYGSARRGCPRPRGCWCRCRHKGFRFWVLVLVPVRAPGCLCPPLKQPCVPAGKDDVRTYYLAAEDSDTKTHWLKLIDRCPIPRRGPVPRHQVHRAHTPP